MFALRGCQRAVLLAAAGMYAAIGAAGAVFAKEGEGSAVGVNLQATGLVPVDLPLFTVDERDIDEFDETNGVVDGFDLDILLLGGIEADVIVVNTRHQPFEHVVDSSAITAGLEVDLGVDALGVAGIPILGLGSDTIESEAMVTGTCGNFSASGGTTIEGLSLSVIGIDVLEDVDVPVNPPPDFEIVDVVLGPINIGPASVEAQVLAIANEQTVAADDSSITVNALRVSVSVDITVLVTTLTQTVDLIVARSDAGFDDCNEVDLSVAKTTDLAGNATVGEPFSYTVAIGNNSAVDATQVEITDQLPSQLEFTAFTETSGGDCSHDAGTIVCQWLTVPAGGSVEATYEVLPVAVGTATNSVGVSTGDINIGDPGDEIDVIIEPGEGVILQVTVTADPDPGEEGQPVTYTVEVANHGTETAEGVEIDLEFGGVPVSIDNIEPPGLCTISGDSVHCDLGDIEGGSAVEIEIVVTPEGNGTLTIIGSVEDDNGNNTPIDSSTVIVESGAGDHIFSDRFEQQ